MHLQNFGRCPLTGETLREVNFCCCFKKMKSSLNNYNRFETLFGKFYTLKKGISIPEIEQFSGILCASRGCPWQRALTVENAPETLCLFHHF